MCFGLRVHHAPTPEGGPVIGWAPLSPRTHEHDDIAVTHVTRAWVNIMKLLLSAKNSFENGLRMATAARPAETHSFYMHRLIVEKDGTDNDKWLCQLTFFLTTCHSPNVVYKRIVILYIDFATGECNSTMPAFFAYALPSADPSPVCVTDTEVDAHLTRWGWCPHRNRARWRQPDGVPGQCTSERPDGGSCWSHEPHSECTGGRRKCNACSHHNGPPDPRTQCEEMDTEHASGRGCLPPMRGAHSWRADAPSSPDAGTRSGNASVADHATTMPQPSTSVSFPHAAAGTSIGSHEDASGRAGTLARTRFHAHAPPMPAFFRANTQSSTTVSHPPVAADARKHSHEDAPGREGTLAQARCDARVPPMPVLPHAHARPSVSTSLPAAVAGAGAHSHTDATGTTGTRVNALDVARASPTPVSRTQVQPQSAAVRSSAPANAAAYTSKDASNNAEPNTNTVRRQTTAGRTEHSQVGGPPPERACQQNQQHLSAQRRLLVAQGAERPQEGIPHPVSVSPGVVADARPDFLAAMDPPARGRLSRLKQRPYGSASNTRLARRSGVDLMTDKDMVAVLLATANASRAEQKLHARPQPTMSEQRAVVTDGLERLQLVDTPPSGGPPQQASNAADLLTTNTEAIVRMWKGRRYTAPVRRGPSNTGPTMAAATRLQLPVFMAQLRQYLSLCHELNTPDAGDVTLAADEIKHAETVRASSGSARTMPVPVREGACRQQADQWWTSADNCLIRCLYAEKIRRSIIATAIAIVVAGRTSHGDEEGQWIDAEVPTPHAIASTSWDEGTERLANDVTQRTIAHADVAKPGVRGRHPDARVATFGPMATTSMETVCFDAASDCASPASVGDATFFDIPHHNVDVMSVCSSEDESGAVNMERQSSLPSSHSMVAKLSAHVSGVGCRGGHESCVTFDPWTMQVVRTLDMMGSLNPDTIVERPCAINIGNGAPSGCVVASDTDALRPSTICPTNGKNVTVTVRAHTMGGASNPSHSTQAVVHDTIPRASVCIGADPHASAIETHSKGGATGPPHPHSSQTSVRDVTNRDHPDTVTDDSGSESHAFAMVPHASAPVEAAPTHTSMHSATHPHVKRRVRGQKLKVKKKEDAIRVERLKKKVIKQLANTRCTRIARLRILKKPRIKMRAQERLQRLNVPEDDPDAEDQDDVPADDDLSDDSDIVEDGNILYDTFTSHVSHIDTTTEFFPFSDYDTEAEETNGTNRKRKPPTEVRANVRQVVSQLVPRSVHVNRRTGMVMPMKMDMDLNLSPYRNASCTRLIEPVQPQSVCIREARRPGRPVPLPPAPTLHRRMARNGNDFYGWEILLAGDHVEDRIALDSYTPHEETADVREMYPSEWFYTHHDINARPIHTIFLADASVFYTWQEAAVLNLDMTLCEINKNLQALAATGVTLLDERFSERNKALLKRNVGRTIKLFVRRQVPVTAHFYRKTLMMTRISEYVNVSHMMSVDNVFHATTRLFDRVNDWIADGRAVVRRHLRRVRRLQEVQAAVMRVKKRDFKRCAKQPGHRAPLPHNSSPATNFAHSVAVTYLLWLFSTYHSIFPIEELAQPSILQVLDGGDTEDVPEKYGVYRKYRRKYADGKPRATSNRERSRSPHRHKHQERGGHRPGDQYHGHDGAVAGPSTAALHSSVARPQARTARRKPKTQLGRKKKQKAPSEKPDAKTSKLAALKKKFSIKSFVKK